MLYKITDMSNKINPSASEPNAPKVNGIEKYRISLNTSKTWIVNIIPNIINKIPGMPKNLNGCLWAIKSIKEKTTSDVCEIGFLVDVLPPVS